MSFPDADDLLCFVQWGLLTLE
jgi:hypothetical protein